MKSLGLRAAISLLIMGLSACGGNIGGDASNSITYNEFYYLGGDAILDTSFIFYDNGRGEMETPGEATECDYTLEGGKISMYVNGTVAEPITLTIVDEFTITDQDGGTYIRPAPADNAKTMKAVMEATQGNAKLIEESGGYPVYVFTGEGELNGNKAWLFSLIDASVESDDRQSYAADENGEVWGLDVFGDWLNISAEQEG